MQKMSLPYILNCLIFSAIFPIHSYSLAGVEKDLFFNNLSVNQGLSDNFCTSIAQDKAGFIWIGTSNGLNLYDGSGFAWFNKNSSSNSLVSDEITVLLADDKNGLYIGTWEGLSYLNTETLKFETIDLGFNIRIRVMMRDTQGYIWIGTDTGLLKYDPESKKYTYLNDQNSNLSHNTVRSIYMDLHGDLWVGTFDKLNRLRKGSPKFESYNLKGNYKPSLKNNMILDIHPFSKSDDSILWIGSETGLFSFNTLTGNFTHFNEKNSNLSNEVIKSVSTAWNGEVWLGTDFGLSIYNPLSGKFRSYYHNPTLPHSIVNNVISSIFHDDASLIWLVTPNGISRYNRFSSFFSYLPVYYFINDNIVGNQVKDIIAEGDSIFWLATMHGVIKYDVSTRQQVIFDNSPENRNHILLNNVNTICDDNAGKIWIGTAGGINIWDKGKKKMSSIFADFEEGSSIKSNYINKFLFGPDGSFWVSSWDGGLYKAFGGFDSPENLTFKLISDINTNTITVGQDALWLINMQNFYRVDLKTLEISQIKKFNSLSQDTRIFSIYYSLRGDIWLGARGGIYEYKISRDSFAFHQIFPGNEAGIINITEDNEGNIWTSSYSTIAKYNTGTGKVELFPVDFEMPLKGFSRGCATRTASGQLIFGGENGLLTFRPEDISIIEYLPRIFISRIKINNTEIRPGELVNGKVLIDKTLPFVKNIKLDYTARSFTLEFSSSYFWQPDRKYYSYKLEGFDDKWNEVSGQKNYATYPNLSPGKYSFKVRGTNNLGEWSSEYAILNIQIKPPLWASPVFIIIYILGFFGIAAGAFLYYDNRLKLKNELKVIRLEKEHSEELSRSKQELFTNISHEFRTPLTLIIGSVEELIKSINLKEESLRFVSLIEKNSRRLLWLNNQLLDFRKLENNSLDLRVGKNDIIKFSREIYELFSDKASRKQIKYDFISDQEVAEVWFDPGKMETILFNLLANAFKFTRPEGSISLIVKVSREPELLYPGGTARLVVKDTGIGISAEEQKNIFDTFYQSKEARKMERGSGIGLTLVKEYTKMHHGEIELNSTPGLGSEFTVILPLGNSHFAEESINDKPESILVPISSGQGRKEEHVSFEFYPDSDKPLLLLVEDDTEMVDFLFISLREKYNIIVSENGDEGYKNACSSLPELIISDVLMPEMDGLMMCKKLKGNPKSSHIPIILISAQNQDFQKIEGLKSGADAFLSKPFTIDLLVTHINGLIKRKKELVKQISKARLLNPKEISPMSSDEKLLKVILEFIENNMSDVNLSIGKISKHTGFGHQYIYRKIKTQTGETLNEFIRNIRIKRAAQLLSTKKLNISEVMSETGFSNHSYFSKCFKKVYKTTPTEYSPETE